MIDFENQITKSIAIALNTSEDEIKKYIEIPKKQEKGDYAFPCFNLAKILRKSPIIIANEIKENIKVDKNIIDKIEVINGYVNFYINKYLLTKSVLEEIEQEENIGKAKESKNKNVIVEYSSPNIAKPFHIGHLRTTLIGNALYKIYKYLGYNTIGINHLGDYGTQFGKIIEAYKMWKDEYNLDEDPINKLMDMYVRINDLCKKDESVLERCRENFKFLEEKREFEVNLWNKIKDLSLKEFNRIYEILNIKFDSVAGESFYIDKMAEVEEILENKGKLIESNGAKIVDLSYCGIDTPCIIKKGDGSSIYATRDLAAILYRARKYDFDKCLYIVAYEQNLHFKQIFEVAKFLVDEKYAKGLEHVSYGMVSLPTGKMSTREGNVVKIEELINATIKKAEEIIINKNPELKEKEEVAKKVGIGAIIFNTLSTVNIKDQVFDWDVALNFQGETGVYIQYTYVRTKSVLEKVEKIKKAKEININCILDKNSVNIVKSIYNFKDILELVTKKNEPSILAKYLIDLAKEFNLFYNENKIIVEDTELKEARIYLTYAVGKVLKQGAELLGMEIPEKM